MRGYAICLITLLMLTPKIAFGSETSLSDAVGPTHTAGDSAPQMDTDGRERITAHQANANRQFQRRLAMTIALGGFTLVTTAISIYSGRAATKRYERIETDADIAATRRLLIVSRTTMGCAIASGLSTAVLSLFLFRENRARRLGRLSLLPAVTESGSVLLLKGAF